MIRKHSLTPLALLLLVVLAAISSACSSAKPEATSSSSENPVPTATESAVKPNEDAAAVLAEAEKAVAGLTGYGFDLELNQHMTGESEDSNSKVKLDMAGRAQLAPLKLDQTNKSDIDGDKSSLRVVLVPDAYYMYDPEMKEWSKLSKEETAKVVKTLSNLQTDPAGAILDLKKLGNGLTVEQKGDETTIRFAGEGTAVRPFLDKVLESTLDLSGMKQQVRDSIQVQSMNVTVKLDAQSHLPLSYEIDASLTVEYEAGKISTLEQTLVARYDRHNAIEAITVPAEAKDAPVLDPPMEESDIDNL